MAILRYIYRKVDKQIVDTHPINNVLVTRFHVCDDWYLIAFDQEQSGVEIEEYLKSRGLHRVDETDEAFVYFNKGRFMYPDYLYEASFDDSITWTVCPWGVEGDSYTEYVRGKRKVPKFMPDFSTVYFKCQIPFVFKKKRNPEYGLPELAAEYSEWLRSLGAKGEVSCEGDTLVLNLEERQNPDFLMGLCIMIRHNAEKFSLKEVKYPEIDPERLKKARQ